MIFTSPDLQKPSFPLNATAIALNPPLVVNANLVHPFKFWQEKLQQGIRFGNELYTHFRSYSTTERLLAYEVAYEQTKQGHSVCITVSKTQYSLWLNLRSLKSPTNDLMLLADDG